MRIPAESQRTFATAQDDRAFWGREGKEEAIAEKYSYVQKLFRDRLFFPPFYTQHHVILSGSEGSPTYSRISL